MQSTLDDDVSKVIANKDHFWLSFVAPGAEPNWSYCSRCGKKESDLKLPDETYLPCKGFVG